MNFLLDTCTFLWLALPPGRLSDEATRQLNDPFNRLYLSDVSVWEITLKHSGGKLPLPAAPRLWLPSRLAFYHVHLLPLTHAAIFRSGELPRSHVDPFDRLLAAQAIESGMTLLSPDLPLSLLGASRMW
ncbi:type II toxin-antitoxin system VapC family toxin [Prosthecobacter sp. SYSU 5D2]|uniref:type II toxin-antitoxin system VapC family toxin n=1 Tax=Prosthecobacter sp. SYSU 5D2 TaxID=3134134 RepID=UPI0031FE6731